MLFSNGKILPDIPAIALLILLTFRLDAECQETILDSLFTFRSGTVKTGNALSIISRQTGYNFTYDSRLINSEEKTKLDFTDTRLRNILDSVLKNDSLAYTVIDQYIIISRSISSRQHSPNTPDPLTLPGSISGIIVDEESKEPLPAATIGLKRKGRGTVTNNNGEFTLRITPDCLNDTLVISYLGFLAREIPLNQSITNTYTIALKREFISIPEIIIKNQIPQEIIFKTVASIADNYGNTPAYLTGFYREGVLKKNELQSYSEAVLHIFKSPYTGSLQRDQIKVYKSRKVENLSSDDTMTVRLKAGLSTILELDGIRNTFNFISRENVDNYVYRITDIVSYDEDAAYLIEFARRAEDDVTIFTGTLYINTDDHALLRADFEISPESLRRMKTSFISVPLKEFITWPVSVNYSVSYRKVFGRYFLNHVRGDLVFASRQKKKIFRTQFRVFLELAVTDINTKNVKRFDREDLAPIHSVFSKTINSYDPDFWDNLDFLKPEDDLLQALKNINVRMHEYSGESL